MSGPGRAASPKELMVRARPGTKSEPGGSTAGSPDAQPMLWRFPPGVGSPYRLGHPVEPGDHLVAAQLARPSPRSADPTEATTNAASRTA